MGLFIAFKQKHLDLSKYVVSNHGINIFLFLPDISPLTTNSCVDRFRDLIAVYQNHSRHEDGAVRRVSVFTKNKIIPLPIHLKREEESRSLQKPNEDLAPKIRHSGNPGSIDSNLAISVCRKLRGATGTQLRGIFTR